MLSGIKKFLWLGAFVGGAAASFYHSADSGGAANPSIQIPRREISRTVSSSAPSSFSPDGQSYSFADSAGSSSSPSGWVPPVRQVSAPDDGEKHSGRESSVTTDVPGAETASDRPQRDYAERVFYGDPSAERASLPWVSSLQTFSDLYQSAYAAGGVPHVERSRNLADAEVGARYCVTLEDVPPAGLIGISLSTGALPPGLSLLSAARQICGVPKQTGIFRFSLAGNYGVNDERFFSYRLVVRASTGSDVTDAPLALLTKQLAVGYVGAAYAFQLSASGGKAPYSWTANGLPSGLELDETSGVIGGAPEHDGTVAVLISVQDNAGTVASASFELIVRTSPVFITSGALEEGVVKTFYQSQLAAQGGLPPYQWEVISALPDGLELDAANGVIRGEPQEVFSGSVEVKVSDKDEKSDTAVLPLKIRATDLVILTRSLAEAFAGEPYQAQLSARGGLTPYNWTIASGELPPGLTLSSDGTLRGETAAAETAQVTVRLTDGSGQSEEQSLALRVINSEASSESSEAEVPAPTPAPTVPDTTGTNGSESSSAPILPQVSGFHATPSDKKAGLVWTLPADNELQRVIIVRSDAEPPQSADDGIVIYQGLGTNLLDENLVNDRTYFYAAYADYDALGLSGGDAGSRGEVTPRAVSIGTKPDSFIDEVLEFHPLDPACLNCSRAASIVLGPPHGAGENAGSSDVVSFGARVNDDQGRSAPYGGSMTLRFTDNIVVDGPGADFIVFENAFRLAGTDLYWIEPAVVEVSADGVHYFRFPFDFVPHFDAAGALNLQNPFSYAFGFAGIKPVYSANLVPDPNNPPVAGGDAFDLSDLPGHPLSWIQFIRITSTGDKWMTDVDGDLVRHMNGGNTAAASGKGNSGFDLDAITAVNF